MSRYTIKPPKILITIEPKPTKFVWYNVMGKEIPLTIKRPVKNFATSSTGVGVFPWSLLKVKKSSLWLAMEDRSIFGNGAIRKITMTQRGCQLL